MAKFGIFLLDQKMSLLLIYIFVLSLPTSNIGQPTDVLSDEFIEYINSHNFTWSARRNFPKKTSQELLKKKAGKHNIVAARALLNKYGHLKYRRLIIESIPEAFDCRDNWPKCKMVISQIGDQGNCDSSWGLSVASAASDRICIEDRGKQGYYTILSAEDLISCCRACRIDRLNGCGGGNELDGWHYWVRKGIVTGGNYDSNQGCRPYSKPSIEGIDSEPCTRRCTNPKYDKLYQEDKHQGRLVYVLPNNVQQIKLDIMNYGPVTTRFDVHEDFCSYEKGVYSHVAGKSLGKHAAKIIGWNDGSPKDHQPPHWIAVNSWGKSWGDNGVFRFPMGKNYLGFEEYVTAGRFSAKLSSREILVQIHDTGSSLSICLSNYLIVLFAILFLL